MASNLTAPCRQSLSKEVRQSRVPSRCSCSCSSSCYGTDLASGLARPDHDERFKSQKHRTLHSLALQGWNSMHAAIERYISTSHQPSDSSTRLYFFWHPHTTYHPYLPWSTKLALTFSSYKINKRQADLCFDQFQSLNDLTKGISKALRA